MFLRFILQTLFLHEQKVFKVYDSLRKIYIKMHFYSQSEKKMLSYMCVYEIEENHQKLSII